MRPPTKEGFEKLIKKGIDERAELSSEKETLELQKTKVEIAESKVSSTSLRVAATYLRIARTEDVRATVTRMDGCYRASFSIPEAYHLGGAALYYFASTYVHRHGTTIHMRIQGIHAYITNPVVHQHEEHGDHCLMSFIEILQKIGFCLISFSDECVEEKYCKLKASGQYK